ncbi:MAG: anti-sigma factor antagonist [Frankiaceae bacterium]|jgi:anti-anti-sigma factor|nr:anti-sigma factor antagonist [Frankiaceae bacterium]
MTAAGFTVQSEHAGDSVRLSVSGELDLLTEPVLVGRVRDELSSADVNEVVIDLRAVSFIDSSGLRALLVCRGDVQRHASRLRLAVGTGAAARLFEVAGVTDWFSYE